MLSKLFLVLAGLLAGMWLRDATGTLFGVGLPLLALLALILAVAADRPARPDSMARMEEAFRQWLDAWSRLQIAPETERASAEQALASAAHMIVVTANDRVVKSLQAATERELSAAAVAQLVLDMRRNLRRAGLTLRPADVEVFLAPRRRGTTRAGAPGAASPASFLS